MDLPIPVYVKTLHMGFTIFFLRFCATNFDFISKMFTSPFAFIQDGIIALVNEIAAGLYDVFSEFDLSLEYTHSRQLTAKGYPFVVYNMPVLVRKVMKDLYNVYREFDLSLSTACRTKVKTFSFVADDMPVLVNKVIKGFHDVFGEFDLFLSPVF